MSRLSRGAFRAGAIAALLAVAAIGGPGTGPTAAAGTPSLTLVAATTYDVLPDAGRVHVTSTITATNHLHDTVTKRYSFRTAYLSVLPGTSAFSLTAPKLKPSVSVAARRSSYTLLRLNFGTDLSSGRSMSLTLQFDLRDPGGVPERPVRISPSIVSFSAWAFATAATSGSSVTVRFPPGYNVAVGRGPLHGPATDALGRLSWTSGRLVSPLSFIADISADRPSDYASSPLSAAIGAGTAKIELRSWPDDPAWRDRVSGLLRSGLPALADAIGLPWPITGDLVVQESLVRTTGGYAGLFDPATNEVQISYTASPAVVLHEAAHAWFNGRLVADRWAAEAFASYYAAIAAGRLKLAVANPILTDTLKAAAFPLNAWGPTGSDSAAAEAYGYAASYAFAQAVAARAGDGALQAVWTKIAGGDAAYQPAAGHEASAAVPDWRGLLDLLEDTTGRSFDDLWRTWIARPEDLALLDQRAAARAAYAKAVADAGPWALPRSIRDAMRAWQFDTATQQIAAAEAVIAQRRQLQSDAATIGATLPATLEAAFSGSVGLQAAAAEASAESATLDAIREAAAADPRTDPAAPAALVWVGLLGAQPDAELAAAKSALEAGNLQSAIADASAAAADWSGAADRGQARLIALGLLALAILLVGRTLMLHRWRPRNGSTDA